MLNFLTPLYITLLLLLAFPVYSTSPPTTSDRTIKQVMEKLLREVEIEAKSGYLFKEDGEKFLRFHATEHGAAILRGIAIKVIKYHKKQKLKLADINYKSLAYYCLISFINGTDFHSRRNPFLLLPLAERKGG